ncbi:hypothetical protein P40081_26215 [Paenibacillus sp. FSL P4-0081]|uniref:hypothetical protein n=1 Tax=Paenibacillus sp. FSL P4-0081 TaxID=1536769 RepID=UPI0004F8AE73|nr:hypothetical protein [Paenibacillus sp. FSL P4-0081]AIQ31268.1 hypothetical protein P40081_26215 [Paenibacillus sp. FSL P4-0081]
MDRKLKQSLKVAAVRRELIVVWLLNGDKIKGIAEVSADPERVKINIIEGPVWVLYIDVEISLVISLRLRVKRKNEPSHPATSFLFIKLAIK